MLLMPTIWFGVTQGEPMKIIRLATLQALTLLAKAARSTAHTGMWLLDCAERIETALDGLATRAGHSVEAVYAPLGRR
jgi:hypothetical protein